MDMQGVLDTGDGSRKRCASSIPADRAIKAMKMEPQDDVPLHVNQGKANALHLHAPLTYSSMLPYVPSNPPSSPPSRPSSPAGLPAHHHTFNPILQQQPQSFNFQDLEHSSSTLQHHDFTGHSRGSSITPTHTAATAGFPSPSIGRLSWSDGHATFPNRQHQHTPSGSSLNGINIHGLGPTSASIPFTPGIFGSGPALPLSQRPGAVMNGVSISPTASRPLGRLSRSGSVNGSASNPFAFGLPEVLPQDPYALNYTRPTTAISTPQTPVSSPEEDYDYDPAFESDAGDQSQSQSPSAKRGRSGTDSGGRPTTGHHNHHLASQSSTENFAQTSNGHGNEVPLEYRSEVDRVFFEFLESICSNC